MKTNIENTMGDFSPQIKVPPRLVFIITGIVKYMQNFITRAKLEQEEAKLQLNSKNQMKAQLHKDTMNQMSLDQKLKMGLFRF